MELCMRDGKEQKLGGRCEGELDAVRRVSRGSSGRRAGEQPASAGAARNGGPGRTERPYERFEPITVRAAARVLQLQRAGVVSAREAQFYLRELTAMDAHAGRGAFPSLARAARRCGATRTGSREPEPEKSRRG
jgi:hypothetical protein